MPLPTVYMTGTATLTAGSVNVVGQGTAWLAAVAPGDLVTVLGFAVRIETINSNNSITLAIPWPGVTRTALAYEILFLPELSRVTAQTRAMLDQLGNGNLAAEAGLTGAADKVSYYTAAGAKTLADFRAFGRTLAATLDLSAAYAALGFGAGTASVTLPQGAAALPGMAFQNDTNTGFNNPAADVIGVSAGGAERARVTTTGLAVGKTANAGITSDNTPGHSVRSDGLRVSEKDNIIDILNRPTAAGQVVSYRVAGTQVGAITLAAASTTYATTSDEEFKRFKGEYDGEDAIRIIKADPVRAFAWDKAHGGGEAIGWGAQTSHRVSADLASPGGWFNPLTGEPAKKGDSFKAYADNAAPIDSEPAEIIDPETKKPVKRKIVTVKAEYRPWGVDQGKRTPYLWAAVANLVDRVTALEAA